MKRINLLLIAIFALCAEVLAAQSPRELERQHDEIMRELSQQEAEREAAVVEVKTELERMRAGIESKLLPPLERIARELELERTTRSAVNRLDIGSQIAEILGNVVLLLVGVVVAFNKAIAMFGRKEKP